MRYTTAACALALCVLLVACVPVTTSYFSNRSQAFVAFDVEFNPNANVPGDPNALKIESSSQNCPPTSASPGCVRFSENTFGTISFRLQGQGGIHALSCDDAGVNWVITSISGSATAMPGNPKKGSGWGTPLPTWVTDAFYPIADASAGLLYEGTVAESKTAVTLLNLNNNPWVEGVVKTLYYRVTATKCDETATKISDPGVENEGLR